MVSVWHQSTVRAIREPMDPMLSNGSRGTLMSYTDHSVQSRLKSNAPIRPPGFDHGCCWNLMLGYVIFLVGIKDSHSAHCIRGDHTVSGSGFPRRPAEFSTGGSALPQLLQVLYILQYFYTIFLVWGPLLTINYYLRLLPQTSNLLLINSKVVKFRYGVQLRDLKYDHAESAINMCFISSNKQAIW